MGLLTLDEQRKVLRQTNEMLAREKHGNDNRNPLVGNLPEENPGWRLESAPHNLMLGCYRQASLEGLKKCAQYS